MPRSLSIEATAQSLVIARMTLLTLYFVVYFYAPLGSVPRLPAMYFAWDATLLVIGWRLAYLFVFTGREFRRRVAIIGSGTAASRIAMLLREISHDVEVVAVVDDQAVTGTVAGFPVLRSVDLESLLARAQVTELVLVRAEQLPSDLMQTLLRAQEQGIAVDAMSTEYNDL